MYGKQDLEQSGTILESLQNELREAHKKLSELQDEHIVFYKEFDEQKLQITRGHQEKMELKEKVCFNFYRHMYVFCLDWSERCTNKSLESKNRVF